MGDSIYALSSQNGEDVEKILCIANGYLSKRNIVLMKCWRECLVLKTCTRSCNLYSLTTEAPHLQSISSLTACAALPYLTTRSLSSPPSSRMGSRIHQDCYKDHFGVLTEQGVDRLHSWGEEQCRLHDENVPEPLCYHTYGERRQEKRVQMEDQEEAKEKSTRDVESGETKNKLTRIQQWAIGVNRAFQVSNGKFLFDPNHVCSTNIVLLREGYESALFKHHLLCQVFRFFGWVCALNLARAKEKVRGTTGEQGFNDRGEMALY